MEKNESTFDRLTSVSVSQKTEKKGNITFLSWAHAWAYTKRMFPDMQRTVYEDVNGHNYHNDGKTGWVKVGITINDIEYIDYLPIMNTMGRPASIPLEQITSFHVNTAIQRSTTKALALHGLGLSIYAGEDLVESDTPATASSKGGPKKPTKMALDIGDVNWKKVLTYVVNNKDHGLETITKNLALKYKLSAPVKKEISKAIKV